MKSTTITEDKRASLKIKDLLKIETSICETRPSGSIFWRLSNGQIHRDHGPAFICSNGTQEWYRHGKRHREDGPAIVDSNGIKEYWIDGVKYRSEKEFKDQVKKLKTK